MSVLRVNQITDLDGTGAVEFSQGVSVSPNKTITGDINLSGICTATAFVGSGIGITVDGGVSNSQIFALTFIT
jgi:hypothetical protein